MKRNEFIKKSVIGALAVSSVGLIGFSENQTKAVESVHNNIRYPTQEVPQRLKDIMYNIEQALCDPEIDLNDDTTTTVVNLNQSDWDLLDVKTAYPELPKAVASSHGTIDMNLYQFGTLSHLLHRKPKNSQAIIHQL